ncbi:3'-5' exonuclease [Sphingobacterium psychroaquaticum]|uniref:DNA polymerase-3 subunit epsilon n=1 Tax=Sphingobacterium psychroaquaticum TaxID=561061 RepID=A0A1X7JRQ6_9SPHI|nr:3'-5' exonuclease [Sphingobacterium psychroaquaticum]SMG31036.1 DNA polymerase-3 subunit epsilon [Sphingobacterium psychroaquaticum]
MEQNLLFIDTETTGLPLRWDRPYNDTTNWPQVIQLAWIVVNPQQEEVKRCNYYIYESDIAISPESEKIHGITLDFLKKNGKRRKDILRKFAHDLKKFNPLIIGHFVELDIQVLVAAYTQCKLKNPFLESLFFCTMLKSAIYAIRRQSDYLRLDQLYTHLFSSAATGLHNAIYDAEAAARCYLHLYNNHTITERHIVEQNEKFNKKFTFKSVDKVIP